MGRFLVIDIVDTLAVRTILPAVARPVHEAIGENIPHLKIVVHSQISLVVMLEDGIDL